MSKVIFKLTFKHPNFKDTVSKNMSHVDYIATRSGVDKTLTEADLQREISKGIEKSMSDDETYLRYIDERPQSHGLFGADGIEEPEQVKNEISEHNSFVWRGIVSLKEEDAKNLGFLTKDKWQDLLRSKVPDMAKEMGIRIDNLRWVGAVHMAKGHPHAHIMVWEKEPEKTVGVISKKSIENIHKIYTDEVFKEEKFRLMTEKNQLRDLIRDLAMDDMGESARLLMEIREAGLEIKTLIREENVVDIPPVMPSKVELELLDMVKHLADNMPGSGRVMLKFMPENIKAEVRGIADYLLNLDEYKLSVENYLKVVEDNNRLYTGKDEDLQKSRENAYNDIRNRVCQVILKAAVESQKDNIFYVDKELADNAVSVIKDIENQINIIEEHQQVFKRLSLALINTGHDDEQACNHLLNYCNSFGLSYSKEFFQDFLNSVHKDRIASQEINTLSSSKRVNFYLSALKLAGYSEEDSFKIIYKTIKSDSLELQKKVEHLKDDGFFKIRNGNFELTNKGIEELLKTKTLDTAQKEILASLEVNPGDFYSLIENKDIVSNLTDKDPEEFKISRYDLKVREEFGDNNRITMNELESNIYEKYTSSDITDIDKADREIDILKNRIEKLCLNGFVELDKNSGVYSFTEEGLYELNNIPTGMDFTRYDANVTLSYIDNAADGTLYSSNLETKLYEEIVNQTAKSYFEKFTAIIDQGQGRNFISIDKDGNITATQEGQLLGKELNNLNKLFKESDKGNLTVDKIRESCKDLYKDNADKQFEATIQTIERQIEKGNIIQKVDGSYSIDPFKNEIKNFLYQIYKAGGTIQKDHLKETLETNVPNKEAEYQYKYIIKKLDFLKSEGYLAGSKGEYWITEKGAEKRLDLLHPERDLLRKEIKYLTRLGFIDHTEEGLKTSDKYFNFMKKVAEAKENKEERSSFYFGKDISHLVDKTLNNLNVDKIERTNSRIAVGKYINNEFKDIKTEYQDIRSSCNVPDLMSRTLDNVTKTLLMAGVSLEETKVIISEWNIKSSSNIDIEKLNFIFDKAYKEVSENNLWGKITVISKQNWGDMFKTLGVDEPPKWMYKGENWQSPNIMYSIINDIWKAAWKQIERERMQTEAQAEMMKKRQIKQQAQSQNKEARVEQYRKNKERNSLSRDDDFEL